MGRRLSDESEPTRWGVGSDRLPPYQPTQPDGPPAPELEGIEATLPDRSCEPSLTQPDGLAAGTIAPGPADGRRREPHPGGGRASAKTLASDPSDPGPPRRAVRRGLPTIPGYEILGELGRGGMGVVYLARQVRLDRKCALKMILAADFAGPIAVARFLAEASAVARVRHPGIVGVYHIADHEGYPFLELEYVEGGSLADRLDGTPMNPDEAAHLVERVARAMAEAHRLGVVHRDLKPANILLATGGAPKVADFGLAKTVDHASGITRTESILGSPSYMSPEQAEGKTRDVGPAADVYALGAILYELLTGRPPFRAATLTETLEQVRLAEPVPPTRLVPGVPRDLETITLACLRKDPGRRFPTDALAADLRRFLDRLPVSARRSGPVERTWRWCRRNRALAALSAALVAALVAVSVGSTAAAILLTRRAGETRLALADMYTAQGLSAARLGRPSEAILWFANAARMARDDPDRARANVVRVRSWGRLASEPACAVELGNEPPKALAFRPGGDLLLGLGAGGRPAVWELPSGRPLAWAAAAGAADLACWSPDGAWAALARPDGAVDVRDAADGRVLQTVPPRGRVGALGFSPDGRLLFVAGATLRAWDTRALVQAAEWALPAGARALALAPGPDGDRVAVATSDGRAHLFRVPRGEGRADAAGTTLVHSSHKDREFPNGGTAPAFVDGGKGLLTVTGEREATWWDVTTGKAVRTLTFRGIGPLRFVAASPDGDALALVGWGGAQLWRASEADGAGRLLAHRHLTTDAAFAADGSTLLTVSTDRTARLWSVPEGKPIGEPVAHQANLFRAALSTDGRHFATAQGNGLVRVWRRPVGPPEDHRPALDFGNVALRLDREGRRVIGTRFGRFGWDHRVARTRAFEVASGRPAGPFLELDGELRDAALSPDGTAAATLSAGPDGGALLRVWDVGTGRPRFAPVALPSAGEAVAFAPGGGRVAAIARGGQVVVADAATGRVVVRFDHPTAPEPDYPIAVRFSPGGDAVVTVGPDSTVGVWDAQTGSPRFPPIRPGGRHVDAAVSADGLLLATGDRDGTLRVWGMADGRPRTGPIRHPDWIFQVRFSRDGRRVLTACRDGQARLWDWADGRLAGPPLRHDDEVWSVDLTPDGRWGLTASRDYTAEVWDLVTGRPVAPPVRLDGQGSSVEVTADGRRAVVGSVGSYPHAIDLSDLSAADDLGPDGLCALGELVSGQRVHEGALAGQTTAEWLAVWGAFTRAHPDRGRLDPGRAADRDGLAADRLLAARRWPEAIAHLGLVLKADPGATRARLARGRALAMLGRSEEAAADRDAAGRSGSEDPRAWVDLGRQHAEQGRAAEADAAYARAARLAPDDPQVFLDGGWWVAGPYPEDLARAQPPEADPDPSHAPSGSTWRPVAMGPNGLIDFGAIFNHAEHASAYATTHLYAPRERPALLLVGSDDTVRVWLNGELVHEHAQPRPGAPEQDQVPVTLRPGRNTLLAKVANATGDHLLYLRLRPLPSPERRGRPPLGRTARD